MPNQALQQTGHANKACARHFGFFRVSRLLSWLFGEEGGAMRLHHQTWLALLTVLGILLAVNLWCWRPGIGGSGSSRPPGTELELFYGWPATYQAEWWRSEDTTLARRLLQSAPFCYSGDMELQARYLRVLPALADVAFAAAALFALGVVVESAVRRFWPRWAVVGSVLAILVMAAVLCVANTISEHV